LRARGKKKKKKKNLVAAAVKQFISEHKAMSMLSKDLTSLDFLLVEVLNNVKAKKIEKVPTQLECLENEEARQIGAALIAIVAKSINGNVGVHAWIEKYPSMFELSQRHKFIVPFFEILATQTVREVNWLMLLKAARKAFVSFFDLITDLYMIFFYFSNDQAEFALATVGMILLSLLMQCFAISCIYIGDKKALKREIFYVLTLSKGARIQLQVLKGENTQGCTMDSVVEMVYFELQEVSLSLCFSLSFFLDCVHLSHSLIVFFYSPSNYGSSLDHV
jgi:hypothetical protein